MTTITAKTTAKTTATKIIRHFLDGLLTMAETVAALDARNVRRFVQTPAGGEAYCYTTQQWIVVAF